MELSIRRLLIPWPPTRWRQHIERDTANETLSCRNLQGKSRLETDKCQDWRKRIGHDGIWCLVGVWGCAGMHAYLWPPERGRAVRLLYQWTLSQVYHVGQDDKAVTKTRPVPHCTYLR